MKHKSNHRKRRIRKQAPARQPNSGDQFFERQVQQKCEKCEEIEKQNVQKKSANQIQSKTPTFFNNYMNGIQGKGNMLSKNKRSFFENKMNDNFQGVRLHNGPEAGKAASEIGAKAFTWKNHIVVNDKYYKEGTLTSQQLLAHELKHVQQQKNGQLKLQMMPEEESNDTHADMPEKDVSNSIPLEKEAEQEETRILGPERLPDFQTFGKAFKMTVFGNSVRFQGKTDADFNDGIGSTRNLARTPSEGCANCPADDCWHYTGTLEINYSVTTKVNLPEIPSGLTPCQHERVREAIDQVISPHEGEHVNIFNRYNGTVSLPIDYTGCSDGIQKYVKQLHDADAAERRAAIVAASDAIDPFYVDVDLDCEEPPTNQPEGDGEEASS